MQQLRLIGLILFITTVFLSLAAFATKTTEIRLFDVRQHSQNAGDSDFNSSHDETIHGDGIDQGQSPKPTFISVPILWPLLFSGGLGLALWFGTAPRSVELTRGRRRRRRRR